MVYADIDGVLYDKELKRILKKLKDIRSGKSKVENDSQPPKPEPTESPKLETRVASESQDSAVPRTAPMYTVAVLPEKPVTADEFIDPKLISTIQKKINIVIKGEAPVSIPMLTRRVVQSFGISRAGSRIQGHMETVLRQMDLKMTQQEGVEFVWKKDQDPDSYIGFRVSGEGDSRRDVRDVPVQEVANAIYTVLYEQISMEQDDLLRETANKLGYTRLGNNVLSALAHGIQYAQAQGGIATGTSGTFVLSKDGTARAEATLKSF